MRPPKTRTPHQANRHCENLLTRPPAPYTPAIPARKQLQGASRANAQSPTHVATLQQNSAHAVVINAMHSQPIHPGFPQRLHSNTPVYTIDALCANPNQRHKLPPEQEPFATQPVRLPIHATPGTPHYYHLPYRMCTDNGHTNHANHAIHHWGSTLIQGDFMRNATHRLRVISYSLLLACPKDSYFARKHSSSARIHYHTVRQSPSLLSSH